MSDPPPEAVQLRAWVWLVPQGQGSPPIRPLPGSRPVRFEVVPGATSSYQFFMSDKVTIQDVLLPP